MIAASPWFTGQQSPTGSDGPEYLTALLFAGFFSGLICPRPHWAQWLGGFLGQLIASDLLLPKGPMSGVTVIVLPVFTVPFGSAAALAAWLRAGTRR